MTARRTDRSVSRRAALAGLGAGGLGVALVGPGRRAAAQDGAGDLAGHPMAGTWLVTTPGGVVPNVYGADGSVVVALPPNYVDPALGLRFQGPALGRWEADGERRGHFTIIQALSDAEGAYTGTFQFEAHPEVSEDGQTFSASTPQRVIVRDAANNVTFDQVLPMDPPIRGTRMGASMESVDLPPATPAAATPAP
ncbi:MAG: hypothetical protein AVDCRST_MAG73-2014 [uncultured Thermomicrobiales bacterium]|uniref:Uncharacterized protein n=1 Tax=uncultured Thermomicrobiales bacterium TaxID=1645740 RepID=A0A6J4U909_9BACT|nr:MAG: hypothetical protein AVDCRST_MAG73-2014 [uncultured Thermomicrobiales bacterium]